jgi:hypothetical protein
MKQTSFKQNFPKRINFFIKNDLKKIKNNLRLKQIKSDGANQIIKYILEDYEKN